MADESKTGEQNGQNDEAKAAAKKPATEYTTVKMDDGREVKFAGKRKVNRDVGFEGNQVIVRFDFRNGKTLSVSSEDIPQSTNLQLLGHGISQKIGDESAGVESVEDMVLGSESMIARLKKGEFNVAREAGDSFSGASIVIRAICEATGKSVDFVKGYLNKKLEDAKTANQKLSRKDLYDSFRNPNSKTGVIIERMEREERSKDAKVNANDLLSEVEGATA